MDRNQAIGFGLIALLLLAYSFFFAGTDEKAATRQATEQVANVEQLHDTPAVENDSLAQAQKAATMGSFATAATGTASTSTLENSNIRITFNTKGGQVEEVLLKNYKTYQGEPLILFDKESNKTDVAFTTNDGKTIKLSDLYFTPSEIKKGTDKDVSTQVISFRANVGNGQYIDQIYTLYDETFQLGYKLGFEGLEGQVSGKNLTYTWTDHIKQLERDMKHNRSKTTINFATVEDGYDHLSISDDKEEMALEEPVKWIANKQNFFTAGIIAENSFTGAKLASEANPADTTIVKTLASQALIPAQDALNGKAEFMYYFGPNDYKILKNIGNDFQKNLDLGWGIFSWVNKWLIIPAFDFLENYIGNYGIIIILLVLYIKTLLFPLTYKSFYSMAKMKVLKPEIDAIKERNDGDMQKTQMETMKLYNEMGVNPLSGCIPMLLQMPILFAMFNFFPNSIELRQEPFLWAADLSTYDVFAKLPFTIPFYGDHVSMFTLLMTASTILYTWSNNQMNAQMQGAMKFYSYLMPVIFMFVLNSFPAGLSFYYFVSNMVTFGQQAIIRKFVDEGKVRAKLEDNKEKRKDKKKTAGPSFTERMQEAMRAASEKEQQKKNKGAKK
ncbi:membrane protein insertase YidC [Pontibacter sp. BT310]|uniref:Membrane protein insertase YidC n=1 Tax=Pontibacter populi TaxID=890055 RepID=A0ABS6XB77_9BACT|nr:MULTISPECIES: membrane protein insertase YidC [Pontibacter]MBJ6118382.1 membrane protein insertase YidC [Pontibacter sp. BT310]MBR0570810.1 membrane protein insertase YidC [Microvirga sp. STS03]MBW3365236.1 membrane protein insertase YidC [Pontibacter populi]